MKEIAAALDLSTRTVETHKYEMMQALGVVLHGRTGQIRDRAPSDRALTTVRGRTSFTRLSSFTDASAQ